MLKQGGAVSPHPTFVIVAMSTAHVHGKDATPPRGSAPDLHIPDEYGFDAFQEFTLEDLIDVKLYPRFPASWKTIDLMPLWRGMTNDAPDSKWVIDEETIATQTDLILREGEPVKVVAYGQRGRRRRIKGTKRLSIATFEASAEDLAKHSYLLNFNREGFHAIYVNGEEQSLEYNGTTAFVDNDSDKGIGLGIELTQYFEGVLDEVRLWNTARSQAEIEADMYLALTGDEDGLVGYWPLDQGARAVAPDLTGANVHGTLEDGVYWSEAAAPLTVDATTDIDGNSIRPRQASRAAWRRSVYFAKNVSRCAFGSIPSFHAIP